MIPLTDRFRALSPRQRWAAGVVAVVLVGALGIRSVRWGLGRRAVEIVDPAIREWAQREVARLSHGRYQLTLSPIQVDEVRRRVSIDTILLRTDLTATSAQATALPVVALQFLGCAVEGIDLDRLTSRRGLHAERAGCESLQLVGEVNPPPAESDPLVDTEGAFLALSENLELPRAIPFVRVDWVSFPHTELSLGITGRTGRRTSLNLDEFAVQLDSFDYDPKQAARERRPLLARDVTIRVSGFRGSQETTNSLAFDSLSASLARGSVALDGFRYEPVAGSVGDSVGIQSLAVATLALTGVDWRAYFTAGDLRLSTLRGAGVLLRFPPPAAAPKSTASVSDAQPPIPSRTVGAILRALGRDVRLDSLAIEDFTMIEGAARGDSVITTLTQLDVLGVHFDDRATWDTPFPVGKVRLLAVGLARRQRDAQLLVQRLAVSVPSGTAQIDSLRLGPDGSDAAFQRRNRYRTDRLVLSAASINVAGLDFPAYLQRGVFRSRLAAASDVDFDLLTDKRKATAPGRQTPNRYPQRFLRELGLSMQVDTVTLTGEARYREHALDAPRPGTVVFRDLRATLLGFSTDPAGDSAAAPFRLIADAKLMGRGAFHFELELPLFSETFAMTYRGRLGPMPTEALNAFAADGAGVRFTSGSIQSIQFEATVSGGRARGRIMPRWEGLGVEFPGMSRKSTGLLGGIKRAAAKFIANAFLVRDDNRTGEKEPPQNGVIDHRWTGRESLPQFLWNSLRDPLVGLMRK